MMKRWIIFLCIGLPLFSWSQTAEVIVYGGIDQDQFIDVVEWDQGYVVLGFTSSTENNNSDLILLRYDTDLQLLWQLALGTDGADQAAALAVDNNGNSYVCGSTSFGENGGYDGYLAKVSPDGDQLWEQSIGDEEWNFGTALEFHNDVLYMAIKNFTPDSDNYQSEVTLIDLDGNSSQTLAIEGQNDETITDFLWYQDQLLVATTVEFSNHTNAELYAFDADLNPIWNHIMEGTEESSFTSHHLDADAINGIGWSTTQFNHPDYEDTAVVVRFEDNGVFIDAYVLPSAGKQEGTSFIWSNDVMITAFKTNIFGAGGQGIYVESRINNGIFISASVFGGGIDEYPSRIFEDSNGRIVIVGNSDSYGLNTVDGYLVRLPNNLIASNYDLDLTEDVDEVFVGIESEYEDHKWNVFPNPAQDRISIQDLNSPAFYEIINMSGTIVQSGQTNGNIQLQLSNGCYFVRIKGVPFTHRLMISNE
ncbi:MAG: T9SS type A sorting domain-containing protein [Bacteroidota bacterium]